MSSRASGARRGTRTPTASPALSDNSDTGRVTRSAARRASQTQLPALASQSSNAYGSAPKLSTAKALNPEAGSAGFAAAFHAHEQTIFEEPELERSSPLSARFARPARARSSRAASSPVSALQRAHEEPLEETDQLASLANPPEGAAAAAAAAHDFIPRGRLSLCAVFFWIVFWLLLGAFGLGFGLYFSGHGDGALAAASSLASPALGLLFSSVPLAPPAVQGPVQAAPRGIDFINFFSPGAGAIIDPRLSSPSMFHWKEQGDKTKFPLLPFPVSQAGPTAALSPWLDLGDCWCTSTMHVEVPDDDDSSSVPADPEVGPANPLYSMQGQLAVSLGHAIFPDRVVVEGPQSSALVDPSARPKDLSLWVEVEDAEQRLRVWAAVLGVDPSQVDASLPTLDAAPPAPSGWTKVLQYLGAGPAPASSMALGETWVRLGQFSPDDVSSTSGTQFGLDADLEALAVPVRRAVLRVDSNFGQAYTCLYRVLLGGKRA